jgi:hypothetical protein
MNTFAVLSLLIPVLGVGLTFLAISLSRKEVRNKTLADPGDPPPKPTSGYVVLSVFTAAVIIFGVFTLYQYWDKLSQNRDLIIYGVWLIIIMIVGMFVQVIVSNYRADKPLFQVSASQLIFPLLLSPFVFYVIWQTAAATPQGSVVYYCAFLNGYFWESTVSKVKPT